MARAAGSGKTAGLPRTERLRKRAAFVAIQGRGKKLHTEHFLVFVLAHPTAARAVTKATTTEPAGSEAPAPRLGVTVSRKIGNAVVRNRVKRVVREAFRRRKTLFPRGIDLVFIAKKQAADVTYDQVSGEIEKLCARYFGR